MNGILSDSVTIIGLGDRERWEAEHRSGGLPSQSWHYCAALASTGVEPKLAVVAAGGARMLLPFYEREFDGRLDITTVLGLSGASIVPSSSAPLARWREHAISRGWVAGYIQLAAGLERSVVPGADEVASHHTVFALDVQHHDLRQRAKADVRRNIRKAIESGSEVVDDRDTLARALVSLYPAAMRRLGATVVYDVGSATLEAWARNPSSVVLGAGTNGEVEAVYIFPVAGAHAESHLLVSTVNARRLTAWLIWHAMGRLRERGVETLNMGGGARHGDGVHAFKARLNGSEIPMYAVRQIYDPAGYEDLCRRAGADATSGWFPAYRPRPLRWTDG